MALTPPFDILQGWPGWTLNFDQLVRKEQSRQTNGVTRTKDFGSPLWSTTVTSKTLSRAKLDYWRAQLNILRRDDSTFYGYALSRTWPIAYPNGTWPTGVAFNGLTANLSAINGNNKAIKLSALPVGFILSVGDFIQVGTTDLYQVLESAIADGTGLTPYFEVAPTLWPGTITGTAVSVKRPHCLMQIVQGSIASPASENGLGKVSFQAIEYR
jgi:hypothetical protein